eukprot:scaffold314748_cov31-Tisochrysis_lutea.AAC.1
MGHSRRGRPSQRAGKGCAGQSAAEQGGAGERKGQIRCAMPLVARLSQAAAAGCRSSGSGIGIISASIRRQRLPGRGRSRLRQPSSYD